jgi:phytoene desaturase
MPLAPGLIDTDELREKYFNVMIERLNKHIQEDIRDAIDYKKSYCTSDFITDYHAYKGNGYGLANTLLQTANLKPSIRNKIVKNLFYTGQLTVPGPGVPPSIVSGKVAAGQLIKHLNCT